MVAPGPAPLVGQRTSERRPWDVSAPVLWTGPFGLWSHRLGTQPESGQLLMIRVLPKTKAPVYKSDSPIGKQCNHGPAPRAAGPPLLLRPRARMQKQVVLLPV